MTKPNLRVHPTQTVHGDLLPPGDKSISHRAVLFSALAKGTSRIRRALISGDCERSLAAVKALGCQVRIGDGIVAITSPGRFELQAPDQAIDCGRSGTTIRLLCGLLAARPFASRLVADPQLARRPMARVVNPLKRMGPSQIRCATAGGAPVELVGGPLKAIRYRMPVASAQVKSALLIAALDAHGVTEIIEPGPARDHTELMLEHMGALVERIRLTTGHCVRILGPVGALSPVELTVPGDPSSAAFWVVAATITSGSDVWLRDVCINPTRDGAVEVLERMGADIERHNPRVEHGEAIADLRVRSAPLRGLRIGGEEIVTMIDELPVLAVAACVAQGPTVVTDAAELRVKETDRIESTANALRAIGAQIVSTADGWQIEGGQFLGGFASSAGDHRIAMALAVAGLVGKRATCVKDFSCASDSYPGFV
ncbi:MAG TPA: 3-phosphoshikimate 1-carboxyvinyltransferase, partial [Myxococcales bacterium]|nr:3-phosphoshikimate 1-carboxyvinyltransferase [Myxococcales bacterium]